MYLAFETHFPVFNKNCDRSQLSIDNDAKLTQTISDYWTVSKLNSLLFFKAFSFPFLFLKNLKALIDPSWEFSLY